MDEGNKETVTKSELLERMLGLGKVMIHLDARKEGVDVPLEYEDDADLRLNISYRFQNADLYVGESKLRARLSFSGHPHVCTVPLDAIFAMISHVSGEGFLFPADAPPEALAGLAMLVSPLAPDEDGQQESKDKSKSGAPEAGQPFLRAIEGGAGRDCLDNTECGEQADCDLGETDEKPSNCADVAPRRRGHLRIIK